MPGLVELGFVEIPATFSTSSVPYVDIPGVTLTLTALASEAWLLNTQLSLSSSAGSLVNSQSVTRYDADGTSIDFLAHRTRTSGTGQTQSLSVLTQAFAAGSRTVKLQGRARSGLLSWERDSIDGATTFLQALSVR